LQRRRKLLDSKLELLTREQEVRARMAEDKERDSGIQSALEEFANLVSKNLSQISFENRQKPLRTVLGKVVVRDWRVDVFYDIPLPQPSPPLEKTAVSGNLRLCSASKRSGDAAYAIHLMMLVLEGPLLAPDALSRVPVALRLLPGTVGLTLLIRRVWPIGR
jgi:hypothetical protein